MTFELQEPPTCRPPTGPASRRLSVDWILQTFKESPFARKLLIITGLLLLVAFLSAAYVTPMDAEACFRRGRGVYYPPPLYYPPVYYYGTQVASGQPYYQPQYIPQTNTQPPPDGPPVPTYRRNDQGELEPIEPMRAKPVMQRAVIIVTIPNNAKLFIDDGATTLTGTVRRFSSPPLDSTKQFYYTLRAEMQRDGEKDTTIQRVMVQGGKETRVKIEFPARTPRVDEEKTSPPQPKKEAEKPPEAQPKKEPEVVKDEKKPDSPKKEPVVKDEEKKPDPPAKAVSKDYTFEGKNLNGLIDRTDGAWKVKDKVLSTAKDVRLFSGQEYRNFSLTMEYMQDTDSRVGIILQGLYVDSLPAKPGVRVLLTGSRVRGPKSRTGNVVHPLGRRLGQQILGTSLQKSVKDNDWNELKLVVKDGEISITINGDKENPIRVKDAKVSTGRIVIHNMVQANLQIRKLEIRDLSGVAPVNEKASEKKDEPSPDDDQ